MSAPRFLRKLLTLTLPALVISGAVLAAGIEAWVRSTWDDRKGSPGLFVSDPVRGQRLAANYDGWFAGVPVRINNLGFRDERDYALEKGPRTFRVLVLGDSVTFGHGAVHTYPRLLEDLLRGWRPDVDWQVWNLGVPGYNTSQELAQLLDVGPRFTPDLVVVGFYDNDLADNHAVAPPGRLADVSSRVLSWTQRHIYSFEWYKRVGLQAAWLMSRNDAFQKRLAHLGTESALLDNVGDVYRLKEQQITPYARLHDADLKDFGCPDGEKPAPTLAADIEAQPGWAYWLDAVHRFHQLHREKQYRVVFFLNIVPAVCPDGDFFYEGGTRALNDYLMRIIADGVPAASTLDAFLRRRPSEMPAARAHAIGNANMTKAEVLFEYLRDNLLASLTPPMPR